MIVRANGCAPPHIRSYVRRENRFTSAQRLAWQRHWPQYALDTARLPQVHACFAPGTTLTLEIGFGNGVSLLALARAQTDTGFIGIEVYRPGIGRLLNGLVAQRLRNVRIVHADAAAVLATAPPAVLFDRVLILFPDPWHKKRHHKRRLITLRFCEQLSHWMKPGAVLLLTTDSQHYAEQMRSAVTACPYLQNLAHLDGFCKRPEWCPVTAFEQRARQPVRNLLCRRVSSPLSSRRTR